MSQSRLVCTAELDLPEDALEASKAQTALLEIFAQFKGALPENNLAAVRCDARVIKNKTKAPKAGAVADAREIDIEEVVPVTGAAKAAGDPPAFLKRGG